MRCDRSLRAEIFDGRDADQSMTKRCCSADTEQENTTAHIQPALIAHVQTDRVIIIILIVSSYAAIILDSSGYDENLR